MTSVRDQADNQPRRLEKHFAPLSAEIPSLKTEKVCILVFRSDSRNTHLDLIQEQLLSQDQAGKG